MSYGLFNWWWGEEEKGPNEYLAKWWKHQRENSLLKHLTPRNALEETCYDGDYLHNPNASYNPKDGRTLFFDDDVGICLTLDRRFRFSDPKRPAQPHPDFMIPRDSDVERRHTNLTQLGWGDSEIFSRLIAQKQLLEQDGAAHTDLLLYCEDDEHYFQELLNYDLKLNTSFFPDKQAYQQFMRDNFILVTPNSSVNNRDDTYYEIFPELGLQQEKYEYLYDDIYGVDWEDRFPPEDLKTILVFRPKLRNYIIEQLMIEFPKQMKWLLDGIIHSTFTTPNDPEDLKQKGLIRTDFMTFLEKAWRKHL